MLIYRQLRLSCVIICERDETEFVLYFYLIGTVDYLIVDEDNVYGVGGEVTVAITAVAGATAATSWYLVFSRWMLTLLLDL